ncbi:sn-glycerol-3-phosphate ABC transporter ATP-binding protein UgpC [Leptothrix discophora]|uniref:Sn-glycerol-3-phosphate ABC transporter ATP-binding protein UgpC n=1 Tax=Leptothrix discophora TaxID=89 RepID=A0ABT9G3S7_LEPDI|nr:sn-glycerol-3-phosphate ABC transporter ATP-binding protein UgpC [Leptothrix discophora]MDP4300902.1 sn-glycerol-3-phosphate ABC transporter ATP-binding protein UgpC [Leptothrix discophora]
MAALSLRGVVKRYGFGKSAQQVVHGVDAEFDDGEFIVIVGPSGCGKSTLLRMVAGLEEISAGQILFRNAKGERVVNDLEPAERDIAMVFQNYALYPHMSVYDNMAYGLKIAGLDKAEIRRRVDKAAAILELGTLLERRPRQLSGGQRQRVAMGRAIVRQPQVFLFDEPLSNLDAKLRAQTRLEIRRLHAELGITSLFVTHDQVEAMTLAQRMVVMNAGRIEQIGTPEAVYAEPATPFVATFIGSPPMNLVETRVEAGRKVRCAGLALDLPADLPFACPMPGEPLLLGVRPEHLGIANDDGNGLSSAATHWPAVVEMVEMLGAERLVHARLATPDAATAPLLTARIDATLPCPVVHARVTLRCAAEHLHGYDPTSQRRLPRA